MSTPTSKFLSALTSELISVLAAPTAGRQSGRPLRDPRLEHAAGGKLFNELITQGRVGYAGDDEDARPVRDRSLNDSKKWLADYLPHVTFRKALPEDTLYFAFCQDRISMNLEEAVPVPREHLWWLVAPGDILLLSDGRTHHYIGVQQVGADDRIYLLDPWPDRVFLKKGLNLNAVDAVIEPIESLGYKLISITRSEFLQVIVGVVTRDTPELIDRYFAEYPALRENFAVQMAFGLALMDAEEEVLARSAAPLFQNALRLANKEHAVDRAEYSAARLYTALVVASNCQRWSGDPLASKPFEDECRHLQSTYPEAQLLKKTRSYELCRLANASAVSRDYTAAMRFLDVAVAQYQKEEEPWRLRAKVRITREEYAEALADITQALIRNSDRIRDLEQRRDAWHPLDRYSQSDDNARIGGLKDRRSDELDMRVTALAGLGRLTEARATAEELIAHAPDLAGGYAKLAVIEQRLGDESAALAHLRQARERENNPLKREQIDALLRTGMAEANHLA